ncbi:MAG TPA: ABC transporter permease [Aggregatilineales bacterium]|nr:ABC transporter permease [Aggregatilineales bacterium]
MSKPGQSLQRTRAIIRKEFKHALFDPGFLFLTLFAPAVMLTLLSYVFSFDLGTTSLALLDSDQSPQSQAFIRQLTADGDITIDQVVGSHEEIVELFREGRVDAALVIPPGFGRNVAAQTPADVNLVVDGSDATGALQAISSIQQRVQAFSAARTARMAAPFDARIRVWYNENLKSQYSMVPGLMAVVLILPPMALALGIAREKESGSLETLVTTPVLGREYLLGKLMVYLLLGVVGALVALALAVFWFRVPFRGSVGLFVLLTADYLFALMGLSLFISNFVASQRTVSAIILLAFFIPSFFLTGLLLPIDTSSAISQALSYSLPATHYITIARGLALKGIGLAALWQPAAALFAMGAASTIASIVVFKKKIA